MEVLMNFGEKGEKMKFLTSINPINRLKTDAYLITASACLTFNMCVFEYNRYLLEPIFIKYTLRFFGRFNKCLLSHDKYLLTHNSKNIAFFLIKLNQTT